MAGSPQNWQFNMLISHTFFFFNQNEFNQTAAHFSVCKMWMINLKKFEVCCGLEALSRGVPGSCLLAIHTHNCHIPLDTLGYKIDVDDSTWNSHSHTVCNEIKWNLTSSMLSASFSYSFKFRLTFISLPVVSICLHRPFLQVFSHAYVCASLVIHSVGCSCVLS